ncbi:MAG: hypothetical protein KF833_00775 [Verrucomicrobiae bacterium]|nr:hypothetical protein [Verrucomicrobiae bacterium]
MNDNKLSGLARVTAAFAAEHQSKKERVLAAHAVADSLRPKSNMVGLHGLEKVTEAFAGAQARRIVEALARKTGIPLPGAPKPAAQLLGTSPAPARRLCGVMPLGFAD